LARAHEPPHWDMGSDVAELSTACALACRRN